MIRHEKPLVGSCYQGLPFRNYLRQRIRSTNLLILALRLHVACRAHTDMVAGSDTMTANPPTETPHSMRTATRNVIIQYASNASSI